MKNKIKEICKKIEKENNIKILFAIENGSRAWRMNSKDSDYDVRFVFSRPLKEYIRIDPLTSVLDYSFNEKGEESSKGIIDMSGFDIFKFLELFSKSNPTTIEWLVSDLVYYGKQNKELRKLALKEFSKKALYNHYKSMCKNNYYKYLKSGNYVSYKKYLYSYRGLINAKWVVEKNSIPPIKFTDTLNKMKKNLPENIFLRLKKIIKLKSRGKEKDIIENIPELDNYIEKFLKEKPSIGEDRKIDTNKLNKELRKVLLK